MKLVNYMEITAAQTLGEMLAEPEYANLSLTDKARLDILAVALNRLPTRYVVTEKGRAFARTDELRHQFMADLVVELAKAIAQVVANPRD